MSTDLDISARGAALTQQERNNYQNTVNNIIYEATKTK